VQYFLTNKIAAPRFFADFSRKVRLPPTKSQVMMFAPPHKGERLAMPVEKSPSSLNGIHYFAEGWRLVRLPGIRRYVIIPLLVNILLLGGAFVWLFQRLGQWIPALMSHIPDWLQWLSYLLWPLSVISIVLVFSYFFSTIANWIAAPFCGLLEKK